MATGVKPRDEDPPLTRSDLELLEGALKDKEFRKLLADYCEEIQDPENQALYQREITQLEKERGVDVTFVNPQPGYVIKTSVAGDRKAFVNICSSDTTGKPACSIRRVNSQKGLDWKIPYTLIPPREDYDQRRQRCVVYDVVFHPDTLRMAANNARFRELVNKTAFDALQNNYKIELDQKNFRFLRSCYKGCSVPAVIRKPDPNFVASENDCSDIAPEIMDKLFPQRSYPQPQLPQAHQETRTKHQSLNLENTKMDNKESYNPYTTPKYVIRQQKNVDLQDFTYDKNNKQYMTIPSQLVVEVNLPLVCASADCTLDVRGKNFRLVCEKPAKYKLELTLAYTVDDERGNAKFDRTKRILIVTLPVSKSNFRTDLSDSMDGLKLDSGIESEDNFASASDDDFPKASLVEELEMPRSVEPAQPCGLDEERANEFLEPHVGYSIPYYTYNVLDDTIAFTFHVKNTDPDSVATECRESNVIRIKFTSIGAGYVPVYYSALLKFAEGISFSDVCAEAWDNNVILQLDLSTPKPDCVFIGLDESSLTCERLNIASSPDDNKHNVNESEEKVAKPSIEVTNMSRETTVMVTSNDSGSESSTESAQLTPSRDSPVWMKRERAASSAKGILRKPLHGPRSLSESSTGDIASSVDYISSDCIPEESSFKKTVRFNEVIARQFYRYNSSIEGQKKKNQRKKSKKRSLERRKSESEAEDEVFNKKVSMKKPDSSEKVRRDSGLADTSDADNDDKTSTATSPTISADPPPARTAAIQHKTDFYDPENLNKGKYLEVNFKNDLIFDLDI